MGSLHTAEEIGIASFQANRGPSGAMRRRRCEPCSTCRRSTKAASHDGRFATLEDVVKHYDDFLKLKLTDQQKRDLIELLKSI
jgi:hypothetical protein